LIGKESKVYWTHKKYVDVTLCNKVVENISIHINHGNKEISEDFVNTARG
jgi:beta-galactosidase beta subunit